MGLYIADLSVLVANLKNETKWRICIYIYIYKSPPLFQIFGLIFFFSLFQSLIIHSFYLLIFFLILVFLLLSIDRFDSILFSLSHRQQQCYFLIRCDCWNSKLEIRELSYSFFHFVSFRLCLCVRLFYCILYCIKIEKCN